MSKYIFDTCVWIDLYGHYPRETFEGLWENLDILLNDGSVVSSSEVLREIGKRDDLILAEVKKIAHLFRKPTIEEMSIAKEIVNKYQYIVKKKSINNGNPEADAFVIAMAKKSNGIVVTTEELKPNAQKIPNVCKDLNIECLHFHDFFKKENWKFKNSK